jgi:hypothetical protein
MKKTVKISLIVFLIACLLPCLAIRIYGAIASMIAPVSSTEAPTSTLTITLTPMPPFIGKLLLSFKGESTVYELAYDANTWTTTRIPIFEGADSAMLSTDKKHLFVYQLLKKKVTIINLTSGEETSFEIQEDLDWFVGYQNSWVTHGLLGGGISISPDNMNVCYTASEGKIYLYNISQDKSWLVYQAPSAKYTPQDKSEVYQFYGEVVCGPWLGVERFVVYRYVGSMPSNLYSDSVVELNTTSIVTIGEKLKFEDIKQWFYVEAISPSGHSMVYTDTESMSTYLVRNFSNFTEMDSQLIIQDRDWQGYFEFLTENQLFFHFRDIVINLENMESREWKLPDKCSESWQWVGNPEDNLIACGCEESCFEEAQVSSSDRFLTPDSYKYSSAILIYDLTTGSLIRIHDLEYFHQPDEISFIGWYP